MSIRLNHELQMRIGYLQINCISLALDKTNNLLSLGKINGSQYLTTYIGFRDDILETIQILQKM